MPATEQTWRDSKLLHLVFGISSLLMLACTIWMLAADHRREWKTYQRKFQGIETWTAQARISQQDSEDYDKELSQAVAALNKARLEVPPGEWVDQFNQQVRSYAREHDESAELGPVDNAYQALKSAPEAQRRTKRDQLRAALTEFVTRARFSENGLASVKKFRAADLDVARSAYEIGVGNRLPQDQLDAMQAEVTEIRKRVDEANDDAQNAKVYRLGLESIVAEMFASETAAQGRLDELNNQLVQLEKALYERENHAMNEIIGLPIIDAFSPKKIDQIWLPKLTINYNFRDVARFDRCTNCHQAIDRTAPGSPADPAYAREHRLVLSMATPAEMPEDLKKDRPSDPVELEQRYNKLLKTVYGLQLAQQGLLDPEDAVVSVVRRESPAAKAGLDVGDCIVAIDDVKLFDKSRAYNYLLETVPWGRPIKLAVRRGLPNPYTSHPRLDLFVGSLSPHKKVEMGCTICHDGQGSATAFKWASHAPNDPLQADVWKREYGWFENHHWIFPMYPKRFSESLCLKCHYDVTELEPSERFPDPPAPKLVEGFQLIKHYGCFGCHEIFGFDGPTKRIGPDLRAEPNYAAAAQALVAQGGLSEQQKTWAREVVREPDRAAARHSLTESLASAEKLPGGDPIYTKDLIGVLADVETPGKLRKVGPSLRHVAGKLDFEFLYSWIRKPTDFRPSTKMPQSFGLWSALGHEGLEASKRYEPIEVRGIAEYLLTGSQPFEYISPPADATAEPSAERGKLAFEVRCLACHQQKDFPQGKMTQGPDLSRIGAKLGRKNNPNGPRWLYTWLRNPSSYHPRTLMPNMMLDPAPGPDGHEIDPAADIAAFLLSSGGWEPANVPPRELNEADRQALEDLALEYLQSTFSKRQAREYLTNGIPARMRNELKGDEVELVGEMSIEKKLRYVGRRSIGKYGCSGCHDIPNFEAIKPIGTGLADWGRKAPDRLAFEQIVEYMKRGHGKPGALDYGKQYDHGPDVTDVEIEEAETSGPGHAFNFLNLDPDSGYFTEKLVHHQREGFIWQKLREPRSYDYKKTQNKSYNERLRMPQFTAPTDAEREAIITFVLGLVSEPPADQYIYQPSPRRAAIAQGSEIIEKYNCTGCHTLEVERWDLAFAPDTFGEPAEIVDFPFLQARFNPKQIEKSLVVDARGLLRATVTGMPLVSETGQPVRVDADGAPLEPDDTQTPASYVFVPWKNVLINGQAWQSGLQNLLIPESAIEKRYPPVGGFLARLAFPTVVAEEMKVNPNAKPDEAWGWLPPPLDGEGRKVQTEWLHDFLLDPYPIRPAVVLRMPKFNMSSDEATKLANYFAAVERVDYPYDFDPRTRQAHLEREELGHPQRLADALKIVIDNNFCVKCHLLGDFDPGGSIRAKAPQLADTYRRLRPEFTLDWIANPKRVLPYTGMPVNVPYGKPVSQELYPGDSDQQLNAVVDLLLNFDRYMESKTSIKPLIKPPAPDAAGNQAAGAQGQAAAQ
ncbi:MAG: PDZ domain-containing protein [Pirellulales bacterium]